MEAPSGIVNACPNALQGVSGNMFLTLINALMAAKCDLGPEGRYPPDYGPNLKDGDEFDFIIVGAGSAGSVVANRLSEIPEWRVLLLEAGGYPSATSEIPSLLFNLQNTEEDWQYKMEPCKTCCLGLTNKRCPCPRGKGLGGSSLINAMFYTRSTKYDHDRWVAAGNDGWDHESILKHYQNLEKAHIENNLHYGTSGELQLTRYTSPHPIRQGLSKAYKELGYAKFTEDKPFGYRDLLSTIYQGRRQSAAKAFLTPAKDRKNLYLAANTVVAKLLIDSNKLSVYGVEAKISDRLVKIKARNEVILSAGSINSPQILMNSGIGPREHLEELGIRVIKNLRVGDNFQDHPVFPGLMVGVNQLAVTPELPTHSLDHFYRFLMHREGPLTQVGITNFAGYLSSQTENEKSSADLQISQILIVQNQPQAIQTAIPTFGLPEEVVNTMLEHNQASSIITFIPALLHPKFRGFLRLKNADPYSKPLITPNLWSDKRDEDLQAMLEAVKIVKKLIKTHAFALYAPKIIYFDFKNCKMLAPESDEYWKCAIRNYATMLFHPVGTCKMGPMNDSAAVVNPRLKVHGVKGVRVIDGSIMPFSPSGNTNAPILMIGEKGASLIKEEWLKNHDEL